jgi:hypothetical protein
MSRDRTKAPAASALKTALHANPDSTGAALALAAGIGRSTATKILAEWEKQGAAVRAPGGRINERPQPDRWSPAPAVPEPHGAPHGDTAPSGPSATPLAPEDAGQAAPSEEIPDGVPPASVAEETGDGGEADAEPSSAAAGDPATSAHEPPATEAAPPTPGPVKAGRLMPGQLRTVVLDHLRAHPTKEFSPTALGRVLGRSSGAIANALARSLNDGEVELVSAKPLRYRAAPS